MNIFYTSPARRRAYQQLTDAEERLRRALVQGLRPRSDAATREAFA